MSKVTAEHRRRRREVKDHRDYGGEVVSVNERFVSLRLCLGVLCRDRTVSGCRFMMGSGERLGRVVVVQATEGKKLGGSIAMSWRGGWGLVLIGEAND